MEKAHDVTRPLPSTFVTVQATALLGFPAGIIERRDAQRSDSVSDNLIQLWLIQSDRGELTDEEAEIGYKNTDGRLSRTVPKGTLGDAAFALLCGCGQNTRMILSHLRALVALIIEAILNAFRWTSPPQIPTKAA